MSNNTDIVDTALKAIEHGALSTNGHPSKSTLIIHSVQRVSYSCDLNVFLHDLIVVSFI